MLRETARRFHDAHPGSGPDGWRSRSTGSCTEPLGASDLFPELAELATVAARAVRPVVAT